MGEAGGAEDSDRRGRGLGPPGRLPGNPRRLASVFIAREGAERPRPLWALQETLGSWHAGPARTRVAWEAPAGRRAWGRKGSGEGPACGAVALSPVWPLGGVVGRDAGQRRVPQARCLCPGRICGEWWRQHVGPLGGDEAVSGPGRQDGHRAPHARLRARREVRVSNPSFKSHWKGGNITPICVQTHIQKRKKASI